MEMKRKGRAVIAGVVDAGMASIATFTVGVFAIRVLDPRTLGMYALVFAAFNLLAVIPAQLLFVPAETMAAGLPRDSRAAVIARSLRAGFPAALFAALVLPALAFAAPRNVPVRAVIVLTGTAAACTLLSPVQDHVRRMLHVAGHSASAAVVSGVQLAAVIATLATGSIVGVDATWIPFGALVAANAISLAIALLLLRRARLAAAPDFNSHGLAQTGRWLLLAGAIGPASAFVTAGVVANIAGAEALGLAEAARVIGQPILVLATGLSAVLGPRSVQAAMARRPADARHVAALFHLITLGGGVVYLALVSFPWPFNPFAPLVPRAYLVTGLAALATLAAITNGALYPNRSELLGLGRPGAIARADAAGAALRISMGATAGITGVFAVPLGFLALGAVRWVGYHRALIRNAWRGAP